MDIKYGMDVCPLPKEGAWEGYCYDFDRLGTIACGLCGANKELATEGQANFLNGMKKLMQKDTPIE